MKRITRCLLLVIAIITLSACGDDHDDVRPGLYTADEVIETFPGDTVLVEGTVSNYVGIATITLLCQEWNITKEYDLSGQKPTVFNYSYQLIVPQDAAFDQEMTVTVRDKNGLENRKLILLKFLPDMVAPTVTGAPAAQVSIDFNTAEQKGEWQIALNCTDDRELKSVRLQLPALGIDETTSVEGRTASYNKAVEFTEPGTYEATITVTDAAGNEVQTETEVIVMLAEDEDPIEDYAQMYVVDASEDADDYVDGYYRYMDRMGEYQYQGKFYAAADGAQMLFTPTKSLDGDLYGASPYVSTKLLNKNGYVVPVTVEKKGYYGVWIDLQAHTVSLWPLDIATDACTEPLWLSGTGFGFADWGASDEMTKTDTYRYEVETTINGSYTGDRQYYFYTSGWARVFRADTKGNWWFESASGSCIIFKTTYDGKVKVSFDTAAPWATIKKVK